MTNYINMRLLSTVQQSQQTTVLSLIRTGVIVDIFV